jgi:amino acid permease
MAFTSTIGFGLFLKAGVVICLAGPGLGTVSMFVSCTIMWSVIAALGEMTALFPVQGPLFEFPCRFLDEGVGFAVGWMAWYVMRVRLRLQSSLFINRFAWVATIAAELVAVANLFTFNFPTQYLKDVGYPRPTLAWVTRDDSPALWITIFLAVILAVNFLPVLYYGELEYLFGCAKMIFITGLIIMNIILSGMQKVKIDNPGDHFWTW